MKKISKKGIKDLWIIFDPLDGPHIFLSENHALKQLRKWEKDADIIYDSVWDMTGPFHYILENKEKKQ